MARNQLKAIAIEPDGSRYHVPNLDRALTILELLSDRAEGLGLTEIVRELDLSKNSVFRITQTLLDRGYLQKDEGSKRFTVSAKLLSLGYRAVSETNLVEKSLDILRHLRDTLKETVLIGSLVETELVVLEQVLGLHPFKFMLDVGMHTALHCNAPGKCILAFLPPDHQEALLAQIELPRFTSHTITTKRALKRELLAIRERGFALDRGEQIEGVHCVAAPVLDRRQFPVAAIWVTGPCDRMTESSFSEIGPVIDRHADQISRRLGNGWLGKEERVGA